MFEALIPRFPDYELIDSGDFEKLERFGRYVVRRPEPQAIWRRSLTEQEWRRLADASFLRDGRSEERGKRRCPSGSPFRAAIGMSPFMTPIGRSFEGMEASEYFCASMSVMGKFGSM